MIHDSLTLSTRYFDVKNADENENIAQNICFDDDDEKNDHRDEIIAETIVSDRLAQVSSRRCRTTITNSTN